MSRRIRTTKKNEHRRRFKTPNEEDLRKLHHMLFGGPRIVNSEPLAEPIIFIDTEEMMNEAYDNSPYFGG